MIFFPCSTISARSAARYPFLVFLVLGLVLFGRVETNFGQLPASVAPEERLAFNRDIRPILSAACLRCHGQDTQDRRAELRLDLFEFATAKRDSGSAIVPNQPDESLLWQRIVSGDPDQVMPPPDATRQLSEQEKNILKQWIAQGAQYEKHWAFEPIRPSANVASNPSTPAEPPRAWIDLAIERQAADANLPILGSADPRTLVRRLAFTLTGLPPQIQDVDRFAQAPLQEAYEKLVDQYLASEHFGEEMAKHWLDVARYGDTHGLHLDNHRQIWPYRDWVVNALNNNMPFDQFTIEQLAGDLLENPTQSQRVATGFNRCNVTTSEGGAINDEFLFRYAVDRTSTTIQAFLGLTGGCAVCHDHKFDPLSTREFYSMYAFFYNNADPAMDGNIQTTAPFLKLTTPEQQAQLDLLAEQSKRSLENLYELAERWRAQVPTEPQAAAPRTATHVWIDDDLPLGATQRNTSRNAERWSIDEVTPPMGKRALVTEFGHKFEQTIQGGLVPKWILENSQLSVWVQVDCDEPPEAIFVEIKSDQGAKRWVWSDQPQNAKLVDATPERIVGKLPTAGSWQLLSFGADGLPPGAMVSEIKVGLYGGICYWDGLSITGTVRPEDNLLSDSMAWWKQHGKKPVPQLETPRFRGINLLEAIQEGESSEVGKQFKNHVKTYFVAWIASEVPKEIVQARQNWTSLETQRRMLEDSIPGTMIYRDLGKPRQAHVMLRGQYDSKGEPVEPGTPAALPSMPKANPSDEKPSSRLELARWIVSDQNPLTARVTVNRYWQQIFGVGLVKTSDDFGTQGTPPSHPQLLDDLAYSFESHGWNIKAFIKELVMTQAFCRDATQSEQALAQDPENRYLARGPRIRLDAEQIRDNALAVSGILNRKLGGPGFRGYQPPNIWEPIGYGDSNTRYYIQQHGQDLYRRSLYAYVKRTAPVPFMSNFDAPNRESFCTRRERSNTPLQALQLMNDVQQIEAARCLAENLIKQSPQGDDVQIDRLFERVLARYPDDYERSQLLRFIEKTRDRIASNPADAVKIASAGERWPDTTLASDQVALWTLVCNLVLNLDETVTRN
ncbi:MAG: PSD1 and planctomycete cytochrome C domain-containing protein [Planctomycetota bacterium]|nr:PSD1 and planctomycete cytochrome C domain-containing protein [Planctomycetota bacterium]